MKKNNIFWVGYSDLMTSLFFIMLVLFVIVYTMQYKTIGDLKEIKDEYVVAKEERDEIKKIQDALEKLDTNYFSFDKRNKRYKLKVDVQFESNSYNIDDINDTEKIKLLDAGQSLLKMMTTLTKQNPNVNYLLIIEGNTQRSAQNYIKIPDVGYRLSYNRALSLVNFWQSNGIDFRNFPNCEILIAGSGYFGKSRERKETENRKFTIQITPKIGEIIKK